MKKTTFLTQPMLPVVGGALILCLIGQSACINHKQLVNFDRGTSFENLETTISTRSLRIQNDDLLAIGVQSQTADPKITAPFTSVPALVSAGIGGATTDAPLYLVDVEGKINMPLVGKIKVGGLTTQEARDTISEHLSRFLKSPIINVRVSNFRFSVLGEVNNAGTYSVGYENVNLLEALGQAGDLTKYGNRENILVIRQTDGKRRYGRVNLHQREVFNSPFFYVEQGDVIYVEPLPAKVGDTADGTTKVLDWALPIVSVLGLLASIFNLRG